MATISVGREILTLINVMEVDPENCDEVASLFLETTNEVISKLDGFISSSVHKSNDGTHVINYAQWESEEALEAVHANPALDPYTERIDALVKSSTPIRSRVASSTSK